MEIKFNKFKFRSRIFILLLFFINLISCSSTKRITIFYSGNINGVYEDCHCPKVSDGSILNHITFQKDSIEYNSEALNLSTGNYFSLNDSGKENIIALELLDSLKYSVFLPGKNDLNFIHEINSIPLVSYNIEGLLPYKMFDAAGTSVCVTGMIEPSFSKYIKNNTIYDKDIVEISDFIDSLKTISEIVIFISNLDPELEKKIFNEVKKIDIMISGENRKNEFFLFENKIYASSGSSAEFIGKLVVEKTAKEVKYLNSFTKMKYNKIPEYDQTKQLVDSLKNKHGIRTRYNSIEEDL